jgi:hypothetical protein
LCLLVAAALAVGGYFYYRLDDEIRDQVEKRLAGHYSQLTVRVGGATYDKARGITIRHISIAEPQGGSASPELLHIDELFLAGRFRVDELLTGAIPIQEIVVRRPQLSVLRRPDGSWNVRTLLPLPKFSNRSPQMVIEDATILVEDAALGRKNGMTLRGIAAQIAPAATDDVPNGTNGRYQIAGTASGLPARELRFHGQLSAADGSFDVIVNVVELEISRQLVTAIPARLPPCPPDVEFAGRADLAVHLTRGDGPASPVGWSMRMNVAGARLHHPQLPQPVSDVACQIEADHQWLRVKQLTGRWGNAEVSFACNRNGWANDAPLGMALRVNGVMLDATILPLLPERFARLWQRFEPTGPVDAHVELAFDGVEWRPNATADCRGISLTDLEKFPYRVEQATGRLEYTAANRGEADRLVINLEGRGGDRPVTIHADLRHLTTPGPDDRPSRTGVAVLPNDHHIVSQPHVAAYRGGEPAAPTGPTRPHPTGTFEITGTDIPVNDPALLKVLLEKTPQGGKLVESLRAQGVVDFRWRAEWRSRLQPRADTALDLTLKECSILFERFEYPLQGVHGRVTERNRHWTVDNVEARGTSSSTVVVCRGEATPVPAGHMISLVFDATNAPLDANLRQALPQGARQAWDELRPQGIVDFVLKPRDRSVSIEPRQFPYRLDEVGGVARYSDGRVDIENFSARHGRVTCSARSGGWEGAGAGSWSFVLYDMHAYRLEPERELFAALPPGVRQVLMRLQPHGMVNLYQTSLKLTKRPGVDRPAFAWDVNLDCHQVTLAGGLPLANITGAMRLTGQADEKGTHTAGELLLHTLTFKDMQFTSIRGPIWANAEICLFGRPAAARQEQEPRPITADAYGGSVTVDARVTHEGAAPAFYAAIALGGADLRRFATERLGGPKDLSGTMSGKLTLERTGPSVQTLRGGGELHVVNANIYELPVLVSMLKVLRNRAPDTTAFNRCDMQFQVQGDRIVFDQLQLLGDAASLYGRGQTSFDRKLDMVFHGLAGPADLPIPLWSTIARQATQQIFEIKVDGTWGEPRTQVNALPTVNNMLEQMASPQAMREAIAPQRR